MRKSVVLVMAFVLFALALVWAASAEGVLAAPHNPPATWASTLIKGGQGSGLYASIAIHPTTGKPWVSYWYTPTNELHLAQYVGEGGNCGNGAWSCNPVKPGIIPTDPITGGMYSSLAFKPDGKPAIAFYGGKDAATIRYAEWSCQTSPIPLCYWSVTDLYDAPFLLTVYRRGDLSLAIGPDGVPRIAVYFPGYSFSGYGPKGYLMYMWRLSSQSGTGCLNNYWQCNTIETANSDSSTNRYVSLALAQTPKSDSDTHMEPHIAYYDENGRLKHAYFPWQSSTGRNCGPGGNTWICETVEDGPNVGKYPVMAVEEGDPDKWMIAYYDQGNKALKFAQYVNSGGNCGGGKWQCDTIEGTVSGATAGIDDMEGNRVFSMATYQGRVAIAYYDNNDAPLGNGTLKWARSGYGLLDGGNCGPQKSIGTPPYMLVYRTWYCETLDGGGYFEAMPYPNPPMLIFRDVGQYPALAYNSSGLAKLAYYDVKSGLRYKEQRLPVYLPLTLKNYQ